MEGMSPQHDPDQVFNNLADAEAVRDRLNQDPPEHGYSPWYLGGEPGADEWVVIRARGVMAEDLDHHASVYEEALRAAVERRAADSSEVWRDLEGIRIERVSLDGDYPDSRLVVLFRAVASESAPIEAAKANCRFGIRWPIWPAEYDDPETEASFHEIYFKEFLGTEPKAYLKLRGPRACDPDAINWLE
jgi:hypothetical protein